MEKKVVHSIKTISEYHRVMGLPKPEHPLISVVDYESVTLPCKASMSFVFDFYTILLDKDFKGNMKYGQQSGDFEEGVMFFMAPGQVFEVELLSADSINRSGWILLIHPDFLWKTSLSKSIRQYEYFSYSVNEALFLSDKEQKSIQGIMEIMAQEYKNNIDKFSEPVILAQLELLLTYADRFYQRQFITRKKSGHFILERLESLLDEYFNQEHLSTKGIPTVQYIASSLNVSPGYLSSLLKLLTGKSTQHYIQDRVIEHVKEQLSTTERSVSEIAYVLGFEHPQSLSRLFKAKTNLSPLEYKRQLGASN
ncbi:helix-turn-helix domain-containing protein [Chitinophaga pinensis]|uniref:Transcriptional regulator, AraC family n=1 Tax=Chitinophaga pinensis (strain ATCC 43595 / DSM 2588 / LMG 13176 / NBRC 15968 / NCIMB 11800 / UQM 2034) TaxID=485918 RepID=A0A979G3M1_CHIPD|nr:helix-turn-helix domain-containing protein [Chitinophaga pinensis]ACU60195.1 transcriptional regulator, AraC family [Chitinophaga pinensis DSM 2588]